jgi:hypothetical protein
MLLMEVYGEAAVRSKTYISMQVSLSVVGQGFHFIMLLQGYSMLQHVLAPLLVISQLFSLRDRVVAINRTRNQQQHKVYT